MTDSDVEEDEFYTLEELEDLGDKSMAYLAGKFKHIRFRNNPRFQRNSNSGSSFRGNSSGNSFRGDGNSRSNMVDRNKFRCFNCNELGHFASECKKPRQARDDKFCYSQYS